MDDAGSGQDGESDSSSSSNETAKVVRVSAAGDVVLDVTFHTSAEAIRASKKVYNAAIRKIGATPPPAPKFDPEIKVSYLVNISALREHSKYFDQLLGNTQFVEARQIQEKLDGLQIGDDKSNGEDLVGLPRVSITDDDRATRSLGRERVFEDLLRILHGRAVSTSHNSVTVAYLVNLAIFADRFDCQSSISRYMRHEMKFKWPVISNRARRADHGKPNPGTEKLLRQQIVVAWLLDQPLRLQQATRELIMRGSARWSVIQQVEDPYEPELWWDLPDGLEHELQYRREAILNTIASVQRHFVALYSSKDRQCQLGYDSSSACDAFQLGQMIKFLTSSRLAHIVDFGPSSLEAFPESATLDLDDLLATLLRCPSYQIDKNHTNCGLRTRLEPIVEFLRATLSSNVIAVHASEWRNNRAGCSWVAAAEGRVGAAPSRRHEEGKFLFVRGMAGDQRLRLEGSLLADKLARKLFTADAWDWTPER